MGEFGEFVSFIPLPRTRAQAHTYARTAPKQTHPNSLTHPFFINKKRRGEFGEFGEFHGVEVPLEMVVSFHP